MRNNINNECVEKLALDIKENYPEFKVKEFEGEIVSYLDDLGLFERINLVTKTLKKFLPEQYPIALNIILKSIKNENGFIIMALSNYVSDYGIDYLDISMNALVTMTKSFSSEFAIRPFIIKYPNQCLEYFKKWVTDESPSVRRLVSEGTRPRLPWGIRLQNYVQDPTPILQFLEILKDDDELFVRRSVANNLNDISKDHPELVINALKAWNVKKSSNVEWIIKHALRTLVKKGDSGALELLGFNKNPKVKIENITYSKVVVFGGELYFSFDLTSLIKDTQKLVIDFVIHFKKANGKNSPKVFKLKNVELPGNKTVVITKNHGIRPISTRKYYAGEHVLYLKINGMEYHLGSFDLQI